MATKTIFKLNIDGVYTSIEKVELDLSLAKNFLEDFDDEYFKTFPAAKKAALAYMTNILKSWQFAVNDMRKQNKENY